MRSQFIKKKSAIALNIDNTKNDKFKVPLIISITSNKNNENILNKIYKITCLSDIQFQQDLEIYYTHLIFLLNITLTLPYNELESLSLILNPSKYSSAYKVNLSKLMVYTILNTYKAVVLSIVTCLVLDVLIGYSFTSPKTHFVLRDQQFKTPEKICLYIKITALKAVKAIHLLVYLNTRDVLSKSHLYAFETDVHIYKLYENIHIVCGIIINIVSSKVSIFGRYFSREIVNSNRHEILIKAACFGNCLSLTTIDDGTGFFLGGGDQGSPSSLLVSTAA
ncbi:hypothetical protein AGLY_003991 [Aphis glycines]|uniref:Uncharacterized protein n=1 Tax=Aphis glycines TaxID=307491 RepID=A0A6G0TWW0_APHGL|nr:hypothetical protein AGLY_003991 [Aphis glycines]